MTPDYFQRLARYNRWANRRIYAACAELPDADYYADRPSFFGSIHATLNHLLVGDRIWLARLEGQPPLGYQLDQMLHADRMSLAEARSAEDERMIVMADALSAERLAGDLHYRTVAGEPQVTPTVLVIGHMFNHQTHHRGQVHGLLSTTAVAPPPLDLIYFLRE